MSFDFGGGDDGDGAGRLRKRLFRSRGRDVDLTERDELAVGLRSRAGKLGKNAKKRSAGPQADATLRERSHESTRRPVDGLGLLTHRSVSWLATRLSPPSQKLWLPVAAGERKVAYSCGGSCGVG